VARPISRGMLSFGLVSIPVQLHTAVREHRHRFRLLHAKDTSPIKYERVCQRDGKPVAWEDLVKGYEYERGRYGC
jgi:DNA end-binding protein Ku